MKPDSTYSKGMRPLTYSVKDADYFKIGWKRDCQNIAYFLTSKPKKTYKNQNLNQFKNPSFFNHLSIQNASNNITASLT